MTHTILIVEDEPELRDMMHDALELSGYAVECAGDGQEALDRLEHIEHVCLVLLDLLMPRMNGWEFYAQLRARPALAAVPVIVHSSAPREVPAGVVRVIQKPMEFLRLVSAVKEFCAGETARQ